MLSAEISHMNPQSARMFTFFRRSGDSSTDQWAGRPNRAIKKLGMAKFFL